MDTEFAPVDGSFLRLPGLFRQWELTELLQTHRAYLLEDAGTHADGSPLLAVYVGSVADTGGDDPHGPAERGLAVAGEAN